MLKQLLPSSSDTSQNNKICKRILRTGTVENSSTISSEVTDNAETDEVVYTHTQSMFYKLFITSLFMFTLQTIYKQIHLSDTIIKNSIMIFEIYYILYAFSKQMNMNNVIKPFHKYFITNIFIISLRHTVSQLLVIIDF